MKQPETLFDNTLYLIGENDKSVRDSVMKIIRGKGHGISPEQFTILVILFYQDGITQTEIGTQLNRDKTTISRVLGRMIKNELITKTTDTGQKRENKIFITPKGMKIQQELIQATGPVYLQALKDIEEKDIEVANRVLRKIFQNMNGSKQ